MHKSMTIDLGDPRVRQMLGVESPTSTGKRAVVQLAGDAPDPSGLTQDVGLMSTHRLTGGKQEALVVFGDLLLTVDIYAIPGEPMRLHLICPRCHKMLTIPGDQKRIQYEPRTLNPRFRHALAMESREGAVAFAHLQFGRLSVETFECTWEITDDAHVAGAVHTGGSLCRLRLVIDDNRAREA